MEPIDRELARLAPSLDSLEVPAPSEGLVSHTLQLASAELRAGTQSSLVQPGHALVPAGFKRELARLLGASARSRSGSRRLPSSFGSRFASASTRFPNDCERSWCCATTSSFRNGTSQRSWRSPAEP